LLLNDVRSNTTRKRIAYRSKTIPQQDKPLVRTIRHIAVSESSAPVASLLLYHQARTP